MLVVAALTAFLILALVTKFKGNGLTCHNCQKQWGRYALIGLLNPVIYYLVLFKAYDLLPAQIAQPINYFWPIVLLVLLAVVTRRAFL